MSQPARLTRGARADVAEVAAGLAGSRRALRALRRSLEEAVRLLGTHPHVGHVDARVADERYRFWRLRGFPYLLVYRADRSPPKVIRVVHAARDLPTVLSDLGQS